ncbi:hypothetical protein [Streptomyces sp. NPDC029721]|uniref:hypothetical protein n=1 Tax=Streptomyces sp. NPDC029721 TaxID=3157090 RepID=UPI0033F6E459
MAYALASAEPSVRVVLSGRRGPGASRAAGAMLGVLGEVTASEAVEEAVSHHAALAAMNRAPPWPNRPGAISTRGRDGEHLERAT